MTIPKQIKYLVGIYFWGIVLFTFFRLLLLIQEFDKIPFLSVLENILLISKGFLMGFRFDSVISGYLLAIPFLILSISYFLKIEKKGVYIFIFYYTCITYILSFLICAIDIPYFHQFFSRLSISAFAWKETPLFVGTMIFQDFKSWWTIIPFMIIATFFYKKNKSITNNILYREHPFPISNKQYLLLFIFFGGLTFLMIRGRITVKSPIRVGTAFFSNYPMINKLGLNPNFTLIRSILDSFDKRQKEVFFIEDKEAVKNVKSYLQIPKNNNSVSPIARKIHFNSVTEKPHKNIVLILMESMSAAKMGRFGNSSNLTPFLDSLSHKGYFFNSIYTVGTHTFSGIYGTLMSLPTIKRQHPLRGTTINKYSGIATTLKKDNYQTLYFTTHDEQFDNVSGFLKANDFDRIISQKDYPPNKVESTLGVPDDYMFEYSIPILNNYHKKDIPFLSVFMTTSDHTPFIIPDYFKPKSSSKNLQIVEYADWALEKFIKLCSTKEWFINTLFVFVADHGAPMNIKYDLPLNYHHTPLIFYAPEICTPKEFSNIGSQIDIFPTIMGILELPFLNNTLGVDLLRTKRPYTFFNADNKYGVLSQEYFFICRDSGDKFLFKIGEIENIYNQKELVADSMNVYAKSMFQTTQWLIKNKKISY